MKWVRWPYPQKPPPGVPLRLDYSHPLVRTPRTVVPFNENGAWPKDYARSDRMLRSFSGVTLPIWKYSTPGHVAWDAPGTQMTIGTPGTDMTLPTTQCTVAVIRRKTDAIARGNTLFASDSGAANRFLTHCPYSDGNIYWDFGGSSSPNRLTITGGVFTNPERQVLVFLAGTRGSSVWNRGALLGSQGTAITRTAGTTALQLNSVLGFDFLLYEFFAVFETEWTPTEISFWSAYPYSIFLVPQILVTPPAGLDTTVREYMTGSASVEVASSSPQLLFAGAAASRYLTTCGHPTAADCTPWYEGA